VPAKAQALLLCYQNERIAGTVMIEQPARYFSRGWLPFLKQMPMQLFRDAAIVSGAAFVQITKPRNNKISHLIKRFRVFLNSFLMQQII
jgi:hypothetical protein